MHLTIATHLSSSNFLFLIYCGFGNQITKHCRDLSKIRVNGLRYHFSLISFVKNKKKDYCECGELETNPYSAKDSLYNGINPLHSYLAIYFKRSKTMLSLHVTNATKRKRNLSSENRRTVQMEVHIYNKVGNDLHIHQYSTGSINVATAI